MQNIEDWQEEIYKGKEIREEETIRYKLLQNLSDKTSFWKNCFILLFLFILINISFEFVSFEIFSNLDFSIMETIESPNSKTLLFFGLFINVLVAYALHKWAYLRVSRVNSIGVLVTNSIKKVIKKETYDKDKFRTLSVRLKLKLKGFLQLLGFKFNGFCKKSVKWKTVVLRLIKEVMLFIISPDYYFAKKSKKKQKKRITRCEDDDCYTDKDGVCVLEWDEIRISRKFFVEFSNWYNVIFTIVIALITLKIWNYKGFLVDILYYFLILRTISRFFEITYAYYKDVVRVRGKTFSLKSMEFYINDWKSSFIRRPARISLAIHSIIEMVILFSLIYYFQYQNLNTVEQQFVINQLISSEKEGVYLEFYHFFLYSLSVSAFNISYTSYPDILWSFTHVLQVVLSLILIILSLAAYLGLKDTLLKREEKFFIEVLKKK